MFLATTILFSLAGDVQAAEFQAQEAQVQTYAEKLRTGKRYALVIGISDYQDEGIEDLGTAAHDAEEVGAMLEGYYGFEVTPLIEEQATRRRILRELSKLASVVTDEDSVIIYFAGHGQRDDQRAFWMPYDAEAGGDADLGAEDTWIPHNELLAKLKKFEATKHILVLSDSCWAGGLFRGDLRGAAGPSTPPANRQFEPWIQKVSEKKSRVIFTSGGDEPVADSTAGVSKAHSIFAHYFLQALQEEFAETPFTTNMLVGFMKPVIGNLEDQQPDSAPIPRLPHEGGEMVFVSDEVRRKAAEPSAKKAVLSTAVDDSMLLAQLQAENLRLRQAAGLTRGGNGVDLVQGKDRDALQSQYLAILNAWTDRLENPVFLPEGHPELAEIDPYYTEVEAEIATGFKREHESSNSLLADTKLDSILAKMAFPLADQNAAQQSAIADRTAFLTASVYLAWAMDIWDIMPAQPTITNLKNIFIIAGHDPIAVEKWSEFELVSRWDQTMENAVDEIGGPKNRKAVSHFKGLISAPQWSPIHYRACTLLQENEPSEVLTGQCDNPGQQVQASPLSSALAHLRKSSAAPSAQDLPFLLVLANNAVQAHWSEGMIGLLEMAVSLAPDDPAVLNLLGLAHFYSESPEGKENARKILAHAATKHPYRLEIQKSLFWLAESPTQQLTALTQMMTLQGMKSGKGWECDTDDCEVTLKRLRTAHRRVRRAERSAAAKERRILILEEETIEARWGPEWNPVPPALQTQLNQCYNLALNPSVQLTGTLNVSTSVAMGRASNSAILEDAIQDQKLNECVITTLNAHTYPPEWTTDLRYSLSFEPN
jgi:hypothetical protein